MVFVEIVQCQQLGVDLEKTTLGQMRQLLAQRMPQVSIPDEAIRAAVEKLMHEYEKNKVSSSYTSPAMHSGSTGSGCDRH
mmetsp:Transcript_4448/g.13309  ORF Transcript_4448/g.13309 Transcript_4448/m.13309 type:complete len:80 (-) Transcript_4448:502-741(-)